MELFVNNETAQLESVVLGIGTDIGKPVGINPLMREHIANNTYPTEADICAEIKTFEEVLIKNGIEIFRPTNILKVDQIFTRDIGFVIEDYFFISNMKHKERTLEINGIQHILDTIDKTKQVKIPKDIFVEGGDVIVWNDYVFVGISDRTTANSVEFIQSILPHKKVLGFEMVVDQDNSDNNILHLDCAFQPIGTDEAIIYYDGFKDFPTELLEIFPKDKLFEVTLDEKNRMFPNVFSISPTKIVLEKGFKRLKEGLIKRGYEIFEVTYGETSKLSGLLRCSTLPLKRKREK